MRRLFVVAQLDHKITAGVLQVGLERLQARYFLQVRRFVEHFNQEVKAFSLVHADYLEEEQQKHQTRLLFLPTKIPNQMELFFFYMLHD